MLFVENMIIDVTDAIPAKRCSSIHRVWADAIPKRGGWCGSILSNSGMARPWCGPRASPRPRWGGMAVLDGENTADDSYCPGHLGYCPRASPRPRWRGMAVLEGGWGEHSGRVDVVAYLEEACDDDLEEGITSFLSVLIAEGMIHLLLNREDSEGAPNTTMIGRRLAYFLLVNVIS